LFAATCLASLQTDLPVSKWIFCEQTPDNAKALKVRVNKYFRGKNVVILESKPENLIDRLKYYVPQSKGSYKVAVFCVVDPFSMDIPFSVLHELNDLGYSFLIPYTFSLNSRLDYKFYTKEQKSRLTKYLGESNEIHKFEGVKSNNEFYKRLVKTQQNNMLMLGLSASLSAHKLDSGLMEMPLYYIGFFSRQLSPKTVQHDIQERVVQQFSLF
jgi:hypothetical protein